jgi:hypothetical protein
VLEVGPPEPPTSIDARGDRIVQGLVGVLLLAAFVFQVPAIVPILAILLGVGAALGPVANPFHRAYLAWVHPRLGPDAGSVPPETIRGQDAFAAVVLAVACVAFVVGLAGVAWFLVIIDGIIAVLAATTMVHVGARVTQRLFHR